MIDSEMRPNPFHTEHLTRCCWQYFPCPMKMSIPGRVLSHCAHVDPTDGRGETSFADLVVWKDRETLLRIIECKDSHSLLLLSVSSPTRQSFSQEHRDKQVFLPPARQLLLSYATRHLKASAISPSLQSKRNRCVANKREQTNNSAMAAITEDAIFLQGDSFAT